MEDDIHSTYEKSVPIINMRTGPQNYSQVTITNIDSPINKLILYHYSIITLVLEELKLDVFFVISTDMNVEPCSL